MSKAPLLLSDTVKVDGLVVRAPEREYDFSEFANIRSITEEAMQFLRDARSANESISTQTRSNIKVFNSTLHFLRFAQTLQSRGHFVDYDRSTYHAYASHMQLYRPSTEVSYLNDIRRLYRYVLGKRGVKASVLPAAKSLKKALATSKGSATLADFYIGRTDLRDRKTLNERLMAQLHEYCWERISQIGQRSVEGKIWCQETAFAALPAKPQLMSREDLIRAIVVYAFFC